MEQAIPVLEIGVVLLVAGLVGVVARRFGFPAVVGYLAVGLVVGPFTPGYVADKPQIEVLADVGVVLLLFEVGIELDLRSLAKEPRGILIAVPLQVALITALGTAIVVALGGPFLGGITLGLVAALSSSVVVVNISRSRKRTTDPATERAMVVWAILQDAVTLVAATLLAVLLSPGGDSPLVALLRALAFIGIGTLVDPRAVAAEPGWLFLFLGLVVLKIAAVSGLAAAFAVPSRRLQLG